MIISISTTQKKRVIHCRFDYFFFIVKEKKKERIDRIGIVKKKKEI